MSHVTTNQDGDRVTAIELFFDLSYVFAFTQVTAIMAYGSAPGSLLEAFIVLSLLWWSWVAYAWLANEARADRGLIRVAFLIGMVTVFVASLAIPETFHEVAGGLSAAGTLVVCYTIVRVAHVAVYFVAARVDGALRRQVVITAATSVLPTVTMLVVGAAAGPPWHRWVWLAAVLYDFAAIYVAAVRGGGWALRSAQHFAERHALVVILALGESTVAIGLGVADQPLSGSVVAAAVLAVGIVVCLWLSYFHSLSTRLEHGLAAQHGPRRVALARDVFTYLHLPMVAGVILTALGAKQALAQVSADQFDASGAGTLCGGVALFLISTAAAARRAERVWPLTRLLAAATVVAAVPIVRTTPPFAGLAIVLSVLAVLGAASRYEVMLSTGRTIARARSSRSSNSESE
jgi:low temperature requirement protein LtrA